MSLIHNERIKLFATYLNGLAIAVSAIGGFAPLFSFLYGTIQNVSAVQVAIISFGCLLASAALHLGASIVLKRLRS